MTAPNNPPAAQQPFVISRTFDAPRSLVFKVWTERDHLLKWFGPKGFTMVTAKLDFRPGGQFHYCLRSPDGKLLWGKWVFREIAPPERLVLISSFSDEQGGVATHPMNPNWPREMVSTSTFVEQNGKTILTLQWLPLNPTAIEHQTFEDGRKSMTMGWGGTFEQLEQYLAIAKQGA